MRPTFTGGMTGRRLCYEDIDGPVMTGPYQGRIDAVRRAVAAGVEGFDAGVAAFDR